MKRRSNEDISNFVKNADVEFARIGFWGAFLGAALQGAVFALILGKVVYLVAGVLFGVCFGIYIVIAFLGWGGVTPNWFGKKN